ncbi:MAG: enoyl-CoA hydratase [Comamonadaceae bacterium]|nr:MAG: enoyl-CoA hydratase [Comamonadaceae bacterium]
MAAILVRREGAVGTVIVSNPQKYNAMTVAMWQDLTRAVEELDADDRIAVIVLTGEGPDAFVSGADISEFESERGDAQAQQRYADIYDAAYLAPVRARKPVIAAIRGICMGGGLGLAAGCDLRVCAADARFRMPAARLGLGYKPAGVERFVALVGVQNTLDVFFTARVFDAAEALRMGFVSRVVEPHALDDTVAALAAAIAENAPLTLQAAKLGVNAMLGSATPAAAQQAADAANASDDYREGVQAFAQKRRPVFRGR